MIYLVLFLFLIIVLYYYHINSKKSPYGIIAKTHLKLIDKLYPKRATGSKECIDAVHDYFHPVFERWCDDCFIQPFEALDRQCYNVIGTIKGTGNTNKQIVIGAHHDGVTYGNAIDDNASGVCVLLEVMQRLAQEQRPYYDVEFVLFDMEEIGDFNGSDHYKNNKKDLDKVIYFINIDTVAIGNYRNVYGNSNPGGMEMALWILGRNKYDISTNPGTNIIPQIKYPFGTTGDWSNDVTFKKIGIPTIYCEASDWTIGDYNGYSEVDPKYTVGVSDVGTVMHTVNDNFHWMNDAGSKDDITFHYQYWKDYPNAPHRLDHNLKTYCLMLIDVLMNWRKNETKFILNI